MKKLTIISLLIITIFLTSCTNDNTYRVGFGYELAPMNTVTVAVSSDTKYFYFENFKLEFHYGTFNHVPTYSDVDYEIHSMALYFSDEIFTIDNFLGSNNGLIDYKNLEDAYFIKEISLEEFNTDQYKVINESYKDKVFNHSETIVIPESISAYTFSFYFTIIDIVYNRKDNLYYFGQNGYYREISYQLVDIDYLKLN
ncbi:hypothetical protein JV173_02785 [Acholeplasma equirhinis]|uniref:hypothetical protein n=1 Tax=Acholeplasma equirhinis TaxID=555393 RepID=UPI00197A7160|nr:hypothetical protein [Acholeplasma equirhinis]MBN3490435.1 hypothetical protein [Acholeplasma equirhinis]